MNTVLAVVSICHSPNHGKRRVAAHMLKNILMEYFDCQAKFYVFVISMAP